MASVNTTTARKSDPTDAICEVDRDFYERELASFIPDCVFDAHFHLWHPDHKSFIIDGRDEPTGLEKGLRFINTLHLGRHVGALIIPIPPKPGEGHKVPKANSWVAKHMSTAGPDFRGLFVVKPEDDPEWVRNEVRRLGLHGFKCYHSFSSTKPTWESDIPDYLPEPLIKVAHEEGWAITLHMVRSRAVADPSNIHWIRHYCEQYPNMKLILAHSARGFQPAHNLEGLVQLTGLDNLYFDTSANCEPMAHQAIIRIIGHKKLMYGSDMPVSHWRGRSVAAADGFLWLYEQTPVWGGKHLPNQPVLIGLECLRSLKWACWSERLSDSAIEDIFWNNAANLFGIR